MILMKNSTSHIHVYELIPDYVLDLSTDRQRQQVIQHIANCRECRQTLESERRLLSTIRASIRSATEPRPQRLMALMPVAARSRDIRLLATTWPIQLAAASLLIILIFGALNMNFNRTGAIWQTGGNSAISTSIITSTAAVTNTPTVTATSVNIRHDKFGNTTVPLIVRNGVGEEDPAITPAPMAPGIDG